MMNSHRYLDPAHNVVTQRRASDPEALRKGKLRQLRRQLSNVRKKLQDMEIEFESSQGYRPSAAEKQGNKNMRKLMTEQSQIKKQIRVFRDADSYIDEALGTAAEDENSAIDRKIRGGLNKDSEGDEEEEEEKCDEAASETVKESDGGGKEEKRRCLESMKNSLLDIEALLRAQRQMKSRPAALEEMSSEQLLAEKHDLQTSLLQFERMFGHPESPEEKELMKGIYDRYRNVKRLVRRSSATRSNKEQSELETIPEDQAIPLTLASPQHRINLEVSTSSNNTSAATSTSISARFSDERDLQQQQQQKGAAATNKSKKTALACEGFVKLKSEVSPSATSVRLNSRGEEPEDEEDEDDAFEEDSNNNSKDGDDEDAADVREEDDEENLHSMSRYELLQVLRKTREEKKRYRRNVKEKEEQFRRETGRRLLREDRDDKVFQLYKNSKAKIKLIDALLSKRVDHYF